MAPKKSASKAKDTSGGLTKAVWYKGRVYSPDVKGDAEAFATAFAKEKDASAHLQKLADKKVVQSGAAAEE